MNCKLCGNDRKLVTVTPYSGLLKGKKKVKICSPCATKIEQNSTKPYTDVLQDDLWSKPVDSGVDAVIRPLRRMNYMVRFGAEVNANPESLSEHSYSVLMLAIQIAKHYNVKVNFERLVSIAMFHDVGEILTGDIPTPLKNQQVKKESDELELKAIDVLKKDWQLWIGDVESYNYKNLDDLESRIVKCADHVSAIVYATEESYIGNNSMKMVRDRSLSNFRKWVQHDWEREIFYHLEDWIREL